MKKERTSSHALTRSPTKGLYEYTKRKCAQMGRIFAYMPFVQ